jgi:hypothetical protein
LRVSTTLIDVNGVTKGDHDSTGVVLHLKVFATNVAIPRVIASLDGDVIAVSGFKLAGHLAYFGGHPG